MCNSTSVYLSDAEHDKSFWYRQEHSIAQAGSTEV